jgi:hypothetical protein
VADMAAVEPLAVALAIGIPVLGKIIIVLWSLRGTQPADRPRIIESVASLFPVTSWQRARRLAAGRGRKPSITTPRPPRRLSEDADAPADGGASGEAPPADGRDGAESDGG